MSKKDDRIAELEDENRTLRQQHTTLIMAYGNLVAQQSPYTITWDTSIPRNSWIGGGGGSGGVGGDQTFHVYVGDKPDDDDGSAGVAAVA